mgnify:CR=1 FL=1
MTTYSSYTMPNLESAQYDAYDAECQAADDAWKDREDD